MKIYYKDEVDDLIEIPIDPEIEERGHLVPHGYGEKVPVKEKLIHKSKFFAVPTNWIPAMFIVSLLLALFAHFLGRITNIGDPNDWMMWGAIAGALFISLFWIQDYCDVRKFNKSQ